MALYLPCLFLSLLLVFASQGKAIHHGHYKVCATVTPDMEERYLNILQKAIGSRAKSVHLLVRSIGDYCGFETSLTRKEAETLAEMDDVITVSPGEPIPLDYDRLYSSMNDEELVGPTPGPITR